MFSWSGRPGPHSPNASAARQGGASVSSSISRNVHISSYLNHSVLQPSTRKVSKDDTIYDTVFQTTNGFALILRVYVPTDPNRAPSMTLHGVRASHSWLDIRMRVIGYGPIASDRAWRSSGMRLGDAVHAVIHHFQLTPPSILEITDANLKRLQETLSPPAPRQNNHHRPPHNHFPDIPDMPNGSVGVESARPEYPPVQNEITEQEVTREVDEREVDACADSLIPPVPHSFLKIDNMSLSDLKKTIDDKAAMRSFVEDTPEVKTLREMKQSIEMSNVNAAKANLAREEELERVCADVDNLRRDLDDKMKRYRELDAERAAMTNPTDRQEAIRELNAAKKDAYRESEELAEEWVEAGTGGEGVGDFAKRFMEVRLLYHARAAKAERLETSM